MKRLTCWLFGHRLVIPTGDRCYDPIRCDRCEWRMRFEDHALLQDFRRLMQRPR